MDKLGYLSRINIMDVLAPEVLEDIAQVAPMSKVQKGTIIVEPRRGAEVLYLLKEGRVRIHKVGVGGREFTIALLGPGNIFGDVGSFTTGTQGAFAEATDDCVLCIMRKPDVERMMKQYPELALRMLHVLSGRLRQMQELLEYIALGDVRSRLLYLLLRLAAEFGADDEGDWTLISADLTHQDLASMISSTRESVSVTLAALGKEEMVRTGRKEIWVHRAKAKTELERVV
jgi:CRP/FNR family transcriptional regulator, anaerobic regulatory protein